MTLTVPKAGSTAGAAAQIRTEPSDTGAVFAQFGQQLTAVGEALENDYLNREVQRFQTDLTGDMNNLRLEVSAIGDPDQAELAWKNGTAALRARYENGLTDDGRARVHEKNKEKFGLVFDNLKNANAFSLGKQTLAARQSQREADYLRFTQIATQESANADPALRDQNAALAIEKIDALVAEGVITPAEGEKRKQGFAQDVDNARAISMVAENPAGFLEAAQGDEFSGLPADVKARYQVQAQGNLARAAAAARTEAERQAKAQAKLVKEKLAEIRDIRDGGLKSVDETWLASDEAKSHPDYAETMATLSLSDQEPMLAQLTPNQLDAMIAGEKSRPVAKQYQTERLAVLEKLKEEAVEGWQTDSVAYAQSIGLIVADLPTFDPAKPEVYGEALAVRLDAAQGFVEKGYTDEIKVLSDDERADLKKQADIENDPVARAALARTLALSLPRTGPDALDTVVDDPVFAHIGGMLAAGGRVDVAEEVLRGQQSIEMGNVVLPSPSERINATFATISDFFAERADGEGDEGAIRKAADALYAVRMRRNDPTGDIDTDVYGQALHEVLGGKGHYGNPDATGGIQDFRGQLVEVPIGISARQIERAFDRIGSEDGILPSNLRAARAAGWEEKYDTVAPARWKSVSRSGSVPVIGDVPLSREDLSELDIKHLGNGQYALTQSLQTDEQIVLGDDGAPFIFDMRKLIALVPQ